MQSMAIAQVPFVLLPILATLSVTEATDVFGHYGDTSWEEDGQSFQLIAIWSACNVTGCGPGVLEQLEDPPQCQPGQTQIGKVASSCPICNRHGRCPSCLPMGAHLCKSFGHRLEGPNGTCDTKNVQRLYRFRQCASCHDDCEECDGVSSSDCTQCIPGKVLVAGTCIEPWIFVVLGAGCGIAICVACALIVIIVKRKSSKSKASVRLRHSSSSTHRTGSHRSNTSHRSSGSGRWVDMTSKNGYATTAPGSHLCHCHSNLAREPSHYSAIQEPDSVFQTSGLYQGLRLSANPSANNSLTKHQPVYEPLHQPYPESSAGARRESKAQVEKPSLDESFENRLAKSHYAPLRPPLHPTYDATYAHPDHPRQRAQSLYGGRVTERVDSPAAGRRPVRDNRYGTAPSAARLKAKKKQLPLFSRWSCLAPGTDVEQKPSCDLEREPSWRFKSGAKEDDGTQKPDLWISSVTIDKPTPVSSTSALAKPDGPTLALHELVEKRSSDPTTPKSAKAEELVRRSSSFTKASSQPTGDLAPGLPTKPAMQTQQKTSPLLQPPLPVRHLPEGDKRKATGNKTKVLPRWSMVPSRTLKLAERRQRVTDRTSAASRGSDTYETPKVISQLDTLSHYYHVLEKVPITDEYDQRWQYGSNPTLTVQKGDRVRRAMSLAPPGARTRSQSLSRDDLLFVHSLVKECGLEGEHDIVVDDKTQDHEIEDDADEILEESSDTESREATVRAASEDQAAAAGNTVALLEEIEQTSSNTSMISADDTDDYHDRCESLVTPALQEERSGVDLSSDDDDDTPHVKESNSDETSDTGSASSTDQEDTFRPVPAPRLMRGRLSNSQQITAMSMEALDAADRSDALQAWSLPAKPTAVLNQEHQHSILPLEPKV